MIKFRAVPTSSGDDDCINAWLEPINGLVEFFSQQQRLDAQTITACNITNIC